MTLGVSPRVNSVKIFFVNTFPVDSLSYSVYFGTCQNSFFFSSHQWFVRFTASWVGSFYSVFRFFFVWMPEFEAEDNVSKKQHWKDLLSNFVTQNSVSSSLCLSLTDKREMFCCKLNLITPLVLKDTAKWESKTLPPLNRLTQYTFDIFTQIYKKGLTKMFEEMVSLKCVSNFSLISIFILITWPLDLVLIL